MPNNVNNFSAAKVQSDVTQVTGRYYNYLIDILSQQIRVLSIAYGTGLVSTGGVLSVGNELTALQALADTAGFLKKVSDGVYSIDTSSYQPLNNELSALSALDDTAGFVKKTGDGAYAIDENAYCTVGEAVAFAIALG